jgi:hypothetical protein
VKCVINNQVVLSRAPEGPLAAHIGSFARSVSEQGYAADSIHRQVLLAACFSRWLKQKGVVQDFAQWTHPISSDWTHLAWVTGGAAGDDFYASFFREASFLALTPR